MGSPVPAVEQAAQVVHQWTDEQFKTLIAALMPKPGVVSTAASDVKAVVAKTESEAGKIVVDVKAFPWGHIVTYVMSVATPIGIHLLGLFGL